VNYVEEAKKLVRDLDQRMGPSPYDIAWMARLREPDGSSRWPDLVEWLLENQRLDGSWGGEIEYYHDRIMCTLTAIVALRENGEEPQATEAVARGERYLWRHLHLLRRDPYELVGFELIFPNMLAEAQSLGLDVPAHTYGYGDIQAKKLRLIPPEMLYSRHISTVHSLEFLGDSANRDRLRQALACNGSLGNSPATTSYYLHISGSNGDDSLAYLEEVRKHNKDTIYLYPFRSFELAWVLNNLAFCECPITEFASQDVWDRLQGEMDSTGIGLDPTFGIPDGDITAVCSRLLIKAGIDVDPDILAQFENEEGVFRTYSYERNASVGTNIHALEALELMPDYPNRQAERERITLMLLDNSIYNVYWVDKWHISPYYATAHVLAGLSKQGPHVYHTCRRTAEWLLHTQRDDGSWGFFSRGTAEETAYALTALLRYHSYKAVNQDALHRGAAYLARRLEEDDLGFPELWIGKCLYTPEDVARSAILAGLILYEQTFDRRPGG
jgi:halimadienyl-diphosphate synthase